MANLPNRPATALPGSIFIDQIMKLGPTGNRDDLIVKEIIRGNFPEFLRKLVPITITKENNTLVYKVMPDYISIGDNADYVRVPISGPSAQKIADAFDMILPTPKISDQIWQNAKTKLTPQPLSGMSNIHLSGKDYNTDQFMKQKMSDTDSFSFHNKIIQNQLGQDHNLGDLVAGHKKDIVLSNDLKPGQLGIHGLHQKDGKPIQGGGASRHNENYQDYSHGVRLIDNNATINGKPITMKEVLQNSEYANMVNEGILTTSSYNYENKPKSDTAVAIKNTPAKPSSDFLQRLNEYLDSIKVAKT